MIKSGLIFGICALLLVMGSALITPLCAPCVGFVFGLVAGYMAGVFDKPASSGDSVRKGGLAGLVAGGFGLIGGLAGGVLNSLILSPTNIEAINKLLGIPDYGVNQGGIWASQLGLAACTGIFNVVWMAVLGVAGGALWYQITGKNQAVKLIPPEGPTSPNEMA